MVRPTGKPLNDKVGAWADGEMEHAIEHWRQQFRGDAPVKDDTASPTRTSRRATWSSGATRRATPSGEDRRQAADEVDEGRRVTSATRPSPPATHVPVLIYPNPLNPAKYVVLNSGFTFREYDYLNNARQVPKLPD